MFGYELSGCGFEFRCSHLNFIYRGSFELGIPWHSCDSKVWIYSETCTWHGKNMQLKNNSFKTVQHNKCIVSTKLIKMSQFISTLEGRKRVVEYAILPGNSISNIHPSHHSPPRPPSLQLPPPNGENLKN